MTDEIDVKNHIIRSLLVSLRWFFACLTTVVSVGLGLIFLMFVAHSLGMWSL